MYQIICRLGLRLQRSPRPPSWFRGWVPGKREGGRGGRGREGRESRNAQTRVGKPTCYFHNVGFSTVVCPRCAPGIEGAQCKFGIFPALCTGVCAPNFKTVSAPMALTMHHWYSHCAYPRRDGQAEGARMANIANAITTDRTSFIRLHKTEYMSTGKFNPTYHSLEPSSLECHCYEENICSTVFTTDWQIHLIVPKVA